MTGEIVLLNRSKSMTPDEFKAAIKALGMTQGEFAEYVGQNIRTVNDWGSNSAPRNAGRVKGEVRFGPPIHIVRLLRHMQRGHITRAPISPSLDDAVTALSASVSSILSEATLKEWPPELAAAALAKLAEIYADANRSNGELGKPYAKSA